MTAYTLSLDDPEAMGRAAALHADRPLLKIKLAGRDDLDRVAAIRANAPDSTLIVDANEGWSPAQVEPLSAALARLVSHSSNSLYPPPKTPCLPSLNTQSPSAPTNLATPPPISLNWPLRYECVNFKLDKTGGFSEGPALGSQDACVRTGPDGRLHGRHFAGHSSGCPAGATSPASSISMAPCFCKKIGEHGLRYEGSLLHPPQPQLWG